jgi:hypothetical protein
MFTSTSHENLQAFLRYLAKQISKRKCSEQNFRREMKHSFYVFYTFSVSIMVFEIIKQTWYQVYIFAVTCYMISHGFWIRDGSVGIATGWMVHVRFPTVQCFPLLQSVQTAPGDHPTSYTMSTGGLHSPQLSVEVKNGGAIPPLSNVSA